MGTINYLQSHWMVISLIWFPAFLGYLNGFVAACKVMGWTKLADELGKLENALKAFVDTVKNKNGGSSDVGKN